MNIKEDKKIIFWVWKPDIYSGGRMIVIHLIKHINSLFDEPVIYSYITNTDILQNDCNNDLNYTQQIYQKTKNIYEEKYMPIVTPYMIHNKNNIFVYPEDIKNLNPLNAKNIVRFCFYFDISKNLNIDNEYYIFFNNVYHLLYEKYNKYNKTPKNVFSEYLNCFNNLPEVLEKCKDLNQERKSSCFIIRKGYCCPHYHPINKKGLPDKKRYNWHPKDAIEIHRKECSLDELIKIFNKYKYFYTYDTFTFLIQIAILCGCKTIVIPYHKKKRDHLKDSLISDYNYIAYYPIGGSNRNYKDIDFKKFEKIKKYLKN